MRLKQQTDNGLETKGGDDISAAAPVFQDIASELSYVESFSADNTSFEASFISGDSDGYLENHAALGDDNDEGFAYPRCPMCGRQLSCWHCDSKSLLAFPSDFPPDDRPDDKDEGDNYRSLLTSSPL